ncbi:MAG: M23 family metallopeptidase [Acidobacteria bacterium]|nr:M23 family metallopeptidase [Acidobacteriota bacterium]MYJ05889.1 M23 family metallopeptidase [Acidobacteriota bacterium]
MHGKLLGPPLGPSTCEYIRTGRYHWRMLRVGIGLLVTLAMAGAVAAWVSAGQAEGPALAIEQPETYVGRTASFVATAEAPGAEFTALDAYIEQNGAVHALFALNGSESAAAQAAVSQETEARLRISRTFDRETHPGLSPGPARVVVTATRPVLFGLRERSSEVAIDVTVRFDPPRLSPVSTFHYINHGGSELVVYRVTPDDADSGVRVGEREYPGYPLSAAGVDGPDDLRVAFFALLHDQDLATPVALWGRDPAGNEASAPFDHRIFERQFRRARLPVGDAFLRSVVPAIAAEAPQLADEDVDGGTDVSDLLDLYLFINRELRRQNRETVSALAAQTAPQRLWDGPFRQLANTQVESGFADHRTYLYGGDEVDQQVHLGFDLASTANAPVSAANAGTVIFADYLGIFGNCVVIDHGLGLQSLYAHLSSIDVAVGATVALGETIGLSGQTGLAGGDHLHFAMLLQGQPVTPMEWWDPQWMEDRIMRKLRSAGGR